MRKSVLILSILLALALLAALGCGDGRNKDADPTQDPETAISVIGIDVNGMESDVYDPADPAATFPPENIISGSYEIPAPGTTQNTNQTPKPTLVPQPTATPDWFDDDWGGDATIVNGDDLW